MTNIFRGYIYKAVNLFFITFVIIGGVAGGSKAEAQVSGGLVNAGFEDPGTDKKTAAGWLPFNQGYKRAARAHTGAWGMNVRSKSFSGTAGAYQRIDLQQSELKPVQITGYVKGNSIVNAPGGWFGASLYAEIHLQNGTVVYWNSVPNFGTFGWRWVGFNTGTLAAVNEPIDHIFVVPLIGNATGQAWFDDIAVKEFEPGAGVVSIMFDDGELSTYEEALPAMEHHGWQGSTAVITEMVDEEGFMNWEQLKGLQSKGWEIVSHGLTHEDLTTMSAQEAKQELNRSKRQLERKGLTINHFALPFGAYNSEIMALGAKEYKSLRAYEQGGTPAGALPWEVKVRGVTAATTTNTIEGWIQEAKDKGQWIVIVYHKIAETGDDAYFTTPADLADMLQTVQDSGIDVVTYNQGWDKFGSR
jgi:peptidoglycan/xylan/chitin deacetylase (PgdA/CDA1 family)